LVQNSIETMSGEAPGTVCLQCGAPILNAAPQGLCPKCLVGMGLSLIGRPAASEAGALSAPTPLLAGNPRRFGDYELLHEIARGGMGVVYRARQISLNRMVAVKVLLFGRFASDTFVKRFRAEAEAAASLQHPNIVAVHEVGKHDGQHYLSMELVEGRDLGQLVHEKPLPPRQAAQLLKTIAEAVEYAHCRGVLHRDLKPSNVLIDAAGQPRVTDFGLAKRFAPTTEAPNALPQPGEQSSVSSVQTADLTLTGQVLGSPNFMPPEQADSRRGAFSAASDVYSLGAVLYHLLTGRPPFLADTLEQTLSQLIHREPVAPRLLNSAIPRDLETICLKCLEKVPARRYATAVQLAEELGRFLRDEPILARPIGRAGRLARWARRKPALSASLALLHLVLGLGLAGIVWQWRRAETNAADAHFKAERARSAEAEATEQLWRSLVQQARAERRTGEAGQRHRALEAVTRAAAIQTSLELRNEAIAALVLPDLNFAPLWTIPYTVPVTDFTPSLTHFAVATASGRIRMFRASDAREENPFPAIGAGWAQQFRFSPDARFVAASYTTGSNVLWEVETRTQVLSWAPGRLAGQFSPDSRRLLTGGSGLVRCLSIPDGRELWRQQVGPRLWGLVVHPRQKYFACFFEGSRHVELRNLDSGELVRSLAHPSPAGILTWSPDGNRLVVGVENGWIYSWDADSEIAPESWKAQDDAVVSLTFAPSGQWLVSSAWDGMVRFWSWPGRSLAVMAHGYTMQAPRFDSDGRRLAGLLKGPVLGQFEVTPSIGFRRFPVALGERRGAWSLDVSPDGKLVAAGYTDGVRLFDFATGRELAFQPAGQCRSAIFMPDGNGLVTSGPPGLAHWPIERMTAAGGVRFGPRQVIRDDLTFIFASMTADGRWVAAADFGHGRVAVYEVNHPTNRFELKNHPDIQHVAISPDGRWVASGTWNGRGIKIWDVSSRQLVKELEMGRAAGVFSPDNRFLVTGSDRIQVWEVGTWREIYHTDREAAFVGLGALTPDGRILAIIRDRRAVQLLEADTGRVLADLEAPGGIPISWVRFTPDGTSLLALEWTRGIQVWDLRRLRTELAALNLDWEMPASPAGNEVARRPKVVEPAPKP
jgi:WD40 repeat protein/predicted Ser/Thr protein kinase